MNFSVIFNCIKDINNIYTNILYSAIEHQGGKVLLKCNSSNEIDEEKIRESDMIITVGGDGTFLKGARKAVKWNIPIVGVNLGSVGFLNEIEKDKIEDSIKLIVTKNYQIEDRMILKSFVYKNNEIVFEDISVNDVVISRGSISRVLHLSTFINEVLVEKIPGDGLIIASPTGSTAYSLSAGGPIVEPDVDMLILTPICPHLLYSKSVVTTGDRVVKVIIDEGIEYNAMVTIDGQIGYSVTGGDVVEIKRATQRLKIVRFNKPNFFQILKQKINNRG